VVRKVQGRETVEGASLSRVCAVSASSLTVEELTARCVPKMDHHCPWTANCVSHTTFPHFVRFVGYACAALALLDYQLYVRVHAIYQQRDLPAYLGPSVPAMVALCLLVLAANGTLLVLTIMLVTALHSLLTNTTMIERWEVERHEALVQRSRRSGGYLRGPGGAPVRIKRQEFPYDIGFWSNAVQGMGTVNVLAWFMPWAAGTRSEGGWSWETNGFDDPGDVWPPVDPDSMARPQAAASTAASSTTAINFDGFRARQAADSARHRTSIGYDVRRREIQRATNLNDGGGGGGGGEDSDGGDGDGGDGYGGDGYGGDGYGGDGYGYGDDDGDEYEEGLDGEQGWTSSDGSRLRDFGVDDDAADEDAAAADNDDDDVPLGELLRRRRSAAGQRAL
jgi:palmitoyltransferase